MKLEDKIGTAPRGRPKVFENGIALLLVNAIGSTVIFDQILHLYIIHLNNHVSDLWHCIQCHYFFRMVFVC